MSTRTERSAWSQLEDADSLENVDKEIQLVSTSTESNYSKENEPVDNVDVKNLPNSDSQNSVEKSLKNQNDTINKDESLSNFRTLDHALHKSFDDLCLKSNDKQCTDRVTCQGNQDDSNLPGSSFANNKRNKKSGKYGHVQSKIKHYVDVKNELPERNVKGTVDSHVKNDMKKEDYLEEINKQLTKELEEKNAILSLLQENYELLLFKYAEAQNRIDELRFKCMTENPEPKNSNQFKLNNVDFKGTPQFLCNDAHANKIPEIKYKRYGCDAVIVPEEQPFHGSNKNSLKPQPSRPLSLPLDNNMKLVDRDVIMTKATTPTDSEGLSSIITSMSGHSKILNSLDEEHQINKKSTSFQCSSGNFILEGSSAINDSFDKVKNWQNSLPPLEQIETPETALYNVFPNSSRGYSSEETKYNDISSPKIDDEYAYLDESCPPSWRDDVLICKGKGCNTQKGDTPLMRNGTETSHNKSHHSVDTDNDRDGMHQDSRLSDGTNQRSKSNSSKGKGRKRSKRHPLLRCSSLPAYDQDSVKSGMHKNGIYIPPLELGNVTLSDDESYCQQDYYLSRSNASSCANSGRGSNERYIQTPQSFSSCKHTISEENFFTRPSPRQTTDKSTSITPERSKPTEAFFSTPKINSIKGELPRHGKNQNSHVPNDRFREKSRENRCNVCGESISKKFNYHFPRHRSNSCESITSNTDSGTKESLSRSRPRPPFKRSVSFGSEAKYCSHEDKMTKNFQLIPSQESLENFEVYANSLKSRSQAVMKALTAHINNS